MKILSTKDLVMINIVAVLSLKGLPFSAKLGLPLISMYLFALLVFFLPICLASCELATRYPNRGGIYVWVKEAFGERWGFLVIFIQWIYNVLWYPTMLLFISGAFTKVFCLITLITKLLICPL